MATIPASFETDPSAIRTQIYLEGVALDLDKGIDVDFTYSISDIADFEKRVTTFSKTVIIPGTAHNNFLFGNYFDFNINNDYTEIESNIGMNFNSLKKASATVTIDNVEIFSGVLRLLEITIVDGSIFYQCALFGSLGGLFTTLGEKLLTDLNLSAFNHAYNISTITNSWTAPDISSVGYVYPMANYGIGVNTAETEYSVKNFRPAVSVKRLFHEIISQAGYTYNQSFWDDNNLSRLIIQNGEEVFSAFYTNLANVSLAQRSTNGVIEFDSFATNGLTVITAGTNDSIKNETGNTINLALNFDIDYTNSMPAFLTAKINTIVSSGSTIKATYSDVVGFGDGTTSNGNIKFRKEIVLENNDFVYFFFTYQDILGGSTGSGFTILTTSSIATEPLTSGSKIPAIYNTNILGKSIVPDGIKQADFVKNIINLLNLYIIQDPNDELKLEFIPYSDFYTSDIVDWSDKLDGANEFSIKPSSDFLPRGYLFKYKTDSDYYSKLYSNKYAQSYGDLTYLTDNEFNKEDNEIEFMFSLAPIVNTGNSTRLMAQLYDINPDGSYKQIKCNPKLSFWGGQKTGNISYSIKNGATTLFTGTNYGYAGHVYDTTLESDGRLWDLVFTAPQEVYFNIAEYPSINLYYQYYQQFIDSQNNKDVKLLTVYLLLNSVDIQNLNFRKLIKINNGIYYLNKIDGYNPTNNVLTQVELLRIVDIEQLDVYVEYTPSPFEGFLSYPRVSIDKALPFNKTFTVQWQYLSPTIPTPTRTSGVQNITISAGLLTANGNPVVAPGTSGYFEIIRILPPTIDAGYIYQYAGDYTTF